MVEEVKAEEPVAKKPRAKPAPKKYIVLRGIMPHGIKREPGTIMTEDEFHDQDQIEAYLDNRLIEDYRPNRKPLNG